MSSSTAAGGIIAAGAGSRMQRLSGEGKALVELSGKPLIGHVLEQFLEAGVSDVVVAIRNDDSRLREFLRRVSERQVFTSVSFVELPSGAGTGEATRQVMLKIGNRNHILSTVDLVAPRFLAKILCDAGDIPPRPDDVLCVLATTTGFQDEEPVWVGCAPATSIVTSFGKDSPRQPSVYGNIRWVSGHAIEWLEGEADFWSARRDTEIVRLLISKEYGTVRARRFGTIYDVDSDWDHNRASLWWQTAAACDKEAPTQLFARTIRYCDYMSEVEDEKASACFDPSPRANDRRLTDLARNAGKIIRGRGGANLLGPLRRLVAR